jgi:hypothetical protein
MYIFCFKSELSNICSSNDHMMNILNWKVECLIMDIESLKSISRDICVAECLFESENVSVGIKFQHLRLQKRWNKLLFFFAVWLRETRIAFLWVFNSFFEVFKLVLISGLILQYLEELRLISKHLKQNCKRERIHGHSHWFS